MTEDALLKRKEALAKLSKTVNGLYGVNTIQTFEETTEKRKYPILSSTGSLNLDEAIGIPEGALVEGRIYEIMGPEASGKTTITLHMIKAVQQAGKVTAFIDMEHAFSPSYAESLGINLQEGFLFSQPDYGEQALNIVEHLIDSKMVDLIIVDSVAALVPQAELEGGMEQHSVGVMARLMNRALRKLTPKLKKSTTTLVFINQIREKIGVIYGSNKTTTGGNGLKFYASVRIDLRIKEKLSHTVSGEKIYDANKVVAKIVKNKLAPPFKETTFNIAYGVGIVRESELVPIALKRDFLANVTRNKKKGIYINYNSQLWDLEEPIEGTENYVIAALQEPEMADVRDELYLRLMFNMKNFSEGHAETQEELDKMIQDIVDKKEYREVTCTKLLAEANQLTNKSEWIKAYIPIAEAYELMPWDKAIKVKYNNVKKRYDQYLDDQKLKALQEEQALMNGEDIEVKDTKEAADELIKQIAVVKEDKKVETKSSPKSEKA